MSQDGVVTCGSCRNWSQDSVNPVDGAGKCAFGDQPLRTKSPYGNKAPHLAYPHAPRWCDRFAPSRKALA